MSYDWQDREKPFSPAAERNRDPILDVLKRHFASATRVLEIGSGTGQHAVYFAPAFLNTLWQTSDVAQCLPGIRAWLDEAALPNTPPPLVLDINGHWPELTPEQRYDAAFTANTLHIVSWQEVQTLFSKLDSVLATKALLAAYGPFNYGGRFTSDSNRTFDGWLKQRSAASGIRNFEDVDALAKSIGLMLVEDCAMPANNHLLVWQRSAAADDP